MCVCVSERDCKSKAVIIIQFDENEKSSFSLTESEQKAFDSVCGFFRPDQSQSGNRTQLNSTQMQNLSLHNTLRENIYCFN